jgi:hypothetical protein
LKNGSIELIAAVDAGALKISAAARLAGLPKEEQAKALKKGGKKPVRSKPDTAGPGYCGRLPQQGGDDTLAFLWVTATGLRTALPGPPGERIPRREDQSRRHHPGGVVMWPSNCYVTQACGINYLPRV